MNARPSGMSGEQRRKSTASAIIGTSRHGVSGADAGSTLGNQNNAMPKGGQRECHDQTVQCRAALMCPSDNLARAMATLPWAGHILLPVNLPPSFSCQECGAIARELRDGWRADVRELRGRLQSLAVSPGRDLRTLGVGWVLSVAEMPDDEMEALLRSHYPRVTKAQRKREEHETASGHSLSGWWFRSQYGLEDAG